MHLRDSCKTPIAHRAFISRMVLMRVARSGPEKETDTMTSSNTTFRACTTDLTVYAVDPTGEQFDMNATGEPCADLIDLRNFVQALCVNGAYGANERDVMLGHIASKM